MNKKILISLSVIGAVAAIAIGGTVAYFTDTETSKGNTFTAGTLDLSIPEPGNPQEFPVSFTDMKPGEWTEKMTLELKNTGSLTHVIDRIQVSGIEENDRKTTVDMEKRTIEKCWGATPDLLELEDKLTVRVGYVGGDDDALFEAWQPEDYGPSGDNDGMTFTYDTDADGVADFQIQYMDGIWRYSGVNKAAEKWEKDIPTDESSWKDVPEEFDYGKDSGGRFWVRIPLEVLGGYDSEYKFGVDSNEKESNCQTFYSTDPAHLWYNGSDYISSDYYVPMSTKSASNVGSSDFAKKINVRVYHDGLIRQGTLWDFYKSGGNSNMIPEGKEITLDPKEEGWYNFEFQLDGSVNNNYQGDGINATFEVEAVQEGQG